MCSNTAPLTTTKTSAMTTTAITTPTTAGVPSTTEITPTATFPPTQPTCPTCPTLPPCQCVPSPVPPNATCKGLGFGFGFVVAAVSGRHSDPATGFDVTWFGGTVVSFAASELVGAVITRDGNQKAIGAYSLPIPSPLGIVAGGFGYVYVEFCFDVCKYDTKPQPSTERPSTTAAAKTSTTTAAPSTTTKETASPTTAAPTATATPRPNITCPTCFGSGAGGRAANRFSLLALMIAFALAFGSIFGYA